MTGMAIPEKIRQLEEQIRGTVEQAVDGLRGGLRERVDQYYKQLVQTLEEVRTDLPAAFLKEEDLSSLVSRAVDDAMAEARTRTALQAAHGTGALRDGLARLDAARSQAAVLEALQEATAAFAGRALIFLVRQDALQGWGQRGFEGDGHDPSRVTFSAGDGVDWGSLIAGGGIARLSSATRAALASRFEAPVSDEAVAVPMILRDRTAAYLLAERTGHEGEGDTLDVAALQTLTYAAALAIETLPFRNRAATSTLAAPPAPLAEETAEAEESTEDRTAAEDLVVEDDYAVGEGLVPEDEQAGADSEPEMEAEPEPQPEEVDVVLGAPGPPEFGAETEFGAEAEDTEPVALASGALEPGEPVLDAPVPDLDTSLETEADTGEDFVTTGDASPYEVDETTASAAPDWRVEDYDAGAKGFEEGYDESEDYESDDAGDYDEDDDLVVPPTPIRAAEPAAGFTETSPREVPPPVEAPAEEVPAEELPAAEEVPSADPVTPASQDTARPVVSGGPVEPPQDVEGPGWAFSAPLKEERSDDEEASHEEARRLARLLVSEIKLYNEEEVQEGRRNHDVARRLRDDIERSRQLYDERVDPGVRDTTDYFYQEMVRLLGAGDPKTLGI
jgi:hypothetical protein